jgi:hypothetical protein
MTATAPALDLQPRSREQRTTAPTVRPPTASTPSPDRPGTAPPGAPFSFAPAAGLLAW